MLSNTVDLNSVLYYNTFFFSIMVVNLLSHLILQNYIPLKVFYLQGGNKQ